METTEGQPNNDRRQEADGRTNARRSLFAYRKEATAMPQNSISAQLSNLQQLVADLEAIENGGKKAISNTCLLYTSRCV